MGTSMPERDEKSFSEEEREEIRQMLRAFQVWQAMGVVGRLATWTLLTIAGVLVAWDQIKTAVSKAVGH